MIWFQSHPLEKIRAFATSNMAAHVGIELVEIGDDYLRGTMPVDDRTRQPFGILHGGASVVLAETLGSVGATLTIDGRKYRAVGQQITTSHLRPVSEGHVTGTASALHLGKRSQVWDIRVEDSEGRLISMSRLTMAIVATT